jgi:hypothetical protein
MLSTLRLIEGKWERGVCGEIRLFRHRLCLAKKIRSPRCCTAQPLKHEGSLHVATHGVDTGTTILNRKVQLSPGIVDPLLRRGPNIS